MTSRISELDVGKSAHQIAAYLKSAGQAGKKVVPFSSERLRHWRWAADPDVVFLNLEQHSQVLDHAADDQVVLVETGISLSALDQYLAVKNQWLPLSSGLSRKSLLEAIITGDGGALAHGYGGPRRLTLGLTAVLSDGTLIRTGGRVVKNVSGYDLTKLIVGSHGIFALPVTAYLRLYARPQRFNTLVSGSTSCAQLLDKARAFERLGLPIVACALIDPRLLTDAQFTDDNSSLLLVRLAGAAPVIEAAIDSILQILSKDGNEAVRLTEAEGEGKLWSELADLALMSEGYLVEVSAPPKLFASLCQADDWPGYPFVFHPRLNEAKIIAADTLEKEALIAWLKGYAKKSAEPLTIRYGDEKYIVRVEKLAPEADEERKLLAALKQRFDPANCLNPFVSF